MVVKTTNRVRKAKKPRAKVQKNKDVGGQFEGEIANYFNKHFQKLNITGIAYRYPSGLRMDQKIDVLIDSSEFLFAGCECKSIADTTTDNGKLYFTKLGNISKKNNLHQFVNQHFYLHDSTRYGLMAFKFRDLGIRIIVPHQMVYEHVSNGDKYITVEEILKSGFDISDEKASLKLFIKKYCKTK